MEIINLGRGQGKTTRLLYASEFNNIPILCATFQQKHLLMDMANKLGLVIPEPIAATQLTEDNIQGSYVEHADLLIDEAPMVLQALINQLGMYGDIKAITLTEKE